jgi:hypothetical protein
MPLSGKPANAKPLPKSKTAIPAYGFRILSPYGRSTPGLVILQF